MDKFFYLFPSAQDGNVRWFYIFCDVAIIGISIKILGLKITDFIMPFNRRSPPDEDINDS